MYAPPPLTLLIPRAFVDHPLPTNGEGVAVCLSLPGPNKEVSFQIGKSDRWGRQNSQTPGITLETFTVFCALLSLADRGPLTYNTLFRLLTPSSGTCSSHHREKLKQLLARLSTIDCASTADGEPTSYAPLVTFETTHTRPVFGRPTPAFTPHFHPLFSQIMGTASLTTHFRLDSLLSIRSRIARSLFCFLPTWAHYYKATAGRPFKISLSKLISHLGLPSPKYPSERKAFFYGHRQEGLFDELQGLPTAYGELCFALTPAKSLSDDCLLVWFKNPTARLRKNNTSTDISGSFRRLKVFEAWKASGRTEAEFVQKIQQPIILTAHDQQLLNEAGIPLSQTDRFLSLAKKLLPESTWQDLLGEARYAATAAVVAPRSPQAKLISEVLNAVRSGI